MMKAQEVHVQERTSTIKKCKTFNGLAKNIRKFADKNGEIVSKSNYYNAEKLASNYETKNFNPFSISHPSAYGIEEQVKVIYDHQLMKKKREAGNLN